jgi:fructoselysine-6-P-deglycase FrlB-like protein
MSKTTEEILTQPDCWRRAAALAGDPQVAGMLPPPGADLAVVGCGTSWFVAQAYSAAREAAGQGRSDPFTASEFPHARSYSHVLAISRSGTTSEVEALLRELPGSTTSSVITGVDDSPCAKAAHHRVLLDFADEESVVQTRFATTALVLLRAALGHDVAAAAADAERALTMPLPIDPHAVDQISFLGTGWTIGLANEAALKCREAAQLWTEAYPAMEYRHGPISIAQSGRAVWPFGPLPPGLAGQIHATGAALVDLGDLDPMASLVLAQRFAVAAAEARGLDPDQPRNLTRSVVLPADQVTS